MLQNISNGLNKMTKSKNEGQLVTLDTTNYSIFKTIKGNRPIQKSHVNNLTKSLIKRNLLHLTPILVNDKYQVIDGQHRLEAAKKLKLPIWYTVVDGLDSVNSFEDMLILNTYARPWGLMDFLGSYVELEFPQYLRVKELYDEIGYLGLFQLLICLASKTTVGGDQVKKIRHDFKNGTYQMTNEEGGLETIATISRMKPYLAEGTWNDRDFLFALRKLEKQDIKLVEKLVLNLEKFGKKIFKRVLVKEYLRDFEDIISLKGSYVREE